MNDDRRRENLGLIADTSISGAGIARDLDALVRLRDKPKSCDGINSLRRANSEADRSVR